MRQPQLFKNSAQFRLSLHSRKLLFLQTAGFHQVLHLRSLDKGNALCLETWKQNVYTASGMQMRKWINVISFPTEKLLNRKIEVFLLTLQAAVKIFLFCYSKQRMLVLSISQHSVITTPFYNCSRSCVKGWRKQRELK